VTTLDLGEKYIPVGTRILWKHYSGEYDRGVVTEVGGPVFYYTVVLERLGVMPCVPNEIEILVLH
jgi:hypothetical protein